MPKPLLLMLTLFKNAPSTSAATLAAIGRAAIFVPVAYTAAKQKMSFVDND